MINSRKRKYTIIKPRQRFFFLFKGVFFITIIFFQFFFLFFFNVLVPVSLVVCWFSLAVFNDYLQIWVWKPFTDRLRAMVFSAENVRRRRCKDRVERRHSAVISFGFSSPFSFFPFFVKWISICWFFHIAAFEIMVLPLVLCWWNNHWP